MRVFRLDLRSLAILRMAIGFLVTLDILLRARDLSAFYTDAGVVTRPGLLSWDWSDPWFSLFLGGSGWLSAAVLFGLTAFFGVQLMRGWRTRWMTFGCWLMLCSLYQRNPLINDRGDLELILVLFWSMFLPLGARWSVDARRDGTPDEPAVLSMGSAALLLQFAQIYLFAALLKHGLPWLRGDALELSLRSALFSTPQSLWLARWPELVNTFTYPVVAMELLLPCLLLSPVANGPVRTIGVLLLVVFHGLVGLLLQLGLFPLIGALLPLGCLPAWFWDRVGSLQAWLDRVVPAPPRSGGAGRLPLPVSLLVGLCLAYTLLCNLFMVGEPSPQNLPSGLRTFGRALRLEQHWDLFAPLPPLDGWFVLRAQVEGQGEVDLLRDQPVSLERPADPSRVFPNHRWRMLMITMIFRNGEHFREPFVRHVAREYRRSHPQARAGRLELLFVVQLVDEQGVQLPPRVWTLWSGPDAPGMD